MDRAADLKRQLAALNAKSRKRTESRSSALSKRRAKLAAEIEQAARDAIAQELAAHRRRMVLLLASAA